MTPFLNFYFSYKIQDMKSKEILRFILILTIIIIQSTHAKEKSKNGQKKPRPTTVTLFVGDQKQQKNEVIKLVLQISQRDVSLEDAIQKAQQTEKQITQSFMQVCKKHSIQNSQYDCEKCAQSSDYNIKAQYYRLRRKELFKTFVVSFQMTFIVDFQEQIGIFTQSIQDLIENNQVQIQEINWRLERQDETQYELIMEEGVERSMKACTNIGMKLDKIKSVSVVEKEEDQDKKKKKNKKKDDEGQDQQEEQEQDQEEEEGQVISEKQERYKFVAVCG